MEEHLSRKLAAILYADAVTCAATIQRDMVSLNQDVPDERKIQFRNWREVAIQFENLEVRNEYI